MVDYQKDMVKIKEALIRRKTLREQTQVALDKSKELLAMLQELQLNAEKARIVVQQVADTIQKDIEEHISNIVSVALASVFEDPYEFKVQFMARRNQTEADMFFVKDGNECEPMDSSGGGALDIASLALRMAIWSIKKTRAIQILDEPAKFLSRDMQSRGSEMLKHLSEKLGIQLIIISHIPEMITAADRVVQVEQKNGISKVRVI